MGLIYHATPHDFSILKSGSWISTSLAEACLHLFMKNIQKRPDDHLAGYVITIDPFDKEWMDNIVIIGQATNATTFVDIDVSTMKRQTLVEAIATLAKDFQQLFYSQEIINLKIALDHNREGDDDA